MLKVENQYNNLIFKVKEEEEEKEDGRKGKLNKKKRKKKKLARKENQGSTKDMILESDQVTLIPYTMRKENKYVPLL